MRLRPFWNWTRFLGMAEEGSLLAIIIARYSTNINRIKQLRRNNIASQGLGDADHLGARPL